MKPIFDDEKQAKSVLAAAKRVTKKRSAGDEPSSPPKKKQKSMPGEILTPTQLEESLALPSSVRDPAQLAAAVIFTNRAPLVLAFAVTLLKYTMPSQPLSARLSLAQAVVSANSRTKAVSLGLESGKSAEDEGWGEGQPVVKIMGRDVTVLRRWGYQADIREEREKNQAAETQDSVTVAGTQEGTQASDVTAIGDVTAVEVDEEQPPLWGVDLESLKKGAEGGGRGPQVPGMMAGGTNSAHNLPIYTPQSARSYLLKSFDTPPEPVPTSSTTEGSAKKGKAKKDGQLSKTAEKERNLGLLLGSLELLFESWVGALDAKELDRRAWSWYVRVRPEVESGVAGWGGKGSIALADILKLRREKEDEEEEVDQV